VFADDGEAVGCRLVCLQDHVITKAGGAAVIADGKAFPEIGQPGTTNRYLTTVGAAVRRQSLHSCRTLLQACRWRG